MKRFFLIVAIIIFISFNTVLSGDYAIGAAAGGDGSESNPFLIADAADLKELMDTQVDWDKHFLVTADIDMDEVTGESPIGKYSPQFTGHFDGNGHVIRNLNIDNGTNDYAGLFGSIDYAGSVTSLGLENATVTSNNRPYIGVFVGNNGGIITDCYAIGSAEGSSSIGGFVGFNTRKISNCYAIGSAKGSRNIGGFVGSTEGGQISYCYSIVNPTGTETNIGGFNGYDDIGNYSCCYWGFEGADLYDIGGDGVSSIGHDLSDDKIEELIPSAFANQSSFSCFDFGGKWMMVGGKPVLTVLTIPTLTEWAVIAFIGLLAGVGGWFVWRRV